MTGPDSSDTGHRWWLGEVLSDLPDRAAYTVWQSRVDAPDFPRDVAWWQGFVPVWVLVRAGQHPDAILLFTDSKSRVKALGRWLATCGGGRLAKAFEVGQPEGV